MECPGLDEDVGKPHRRSLRPEYHQEYADYLSQVVAAYQSRGIFLTAISIQNEPGFSPPDYPGMTLTPDQQAELIVHLVGPALIRTHSRTGILLLDHNWSNIASLLPVLQREDLRQSILGIAVHGYHGDPGQQRQLLTAAPGLAIWETECSGGTWSPTDGEALSWDSLVLVIRGMRNGSGSVVFWNLALDASGGPALLLRHLRDLVPGAHLIESADPPGVETAAWRNPDGSFVVLATAPAEDWNGPLTVGERTVQIAVPRGGLCTLTWTDA